MTRFPCQIDRYLLGLMFSRLLVVLAVALVALLAERVLRLFDLATAYGAEVSPVLRMVASLVPYYLGLALPIAFCIAVLGAMRQLSDSSEAVAMGSAGWSVRRIGLPFVACGLVFCILSQLLFGVIQPGFRYLYEGIRYDLVHAGWNGRVEEGMFFKVDEGFLISTGGIDKTGRVLDQVFVLNEGKEGITIMTATGGIIAPDLESSRVVLQLNNGRLLLPEGRFIDFNQTNVQHKFELPTPFRERGESARELTTWELWDAMSDDARSGDPQYAIEFHNRLVRSISLIGIALMAVPLGVANARAPGWVSPVVAIGILAIFDNAIKFVDGLAHNGHLDPALGMWGLAFIFNGGALWLYMTTTGGAWGPLSTLRRAVRRRVDGYLHGKPS